MSLKRISFALSLTIVACDGEQSEPSTYAEMNFEQRRVFMTEVVLPEMRPIFVAFDARYESMDCATCHGDGASDGTYAMPSPQLPRLPATEEAFLEYIKDPEHARWSRFMMDEVWPETAALLEVPTFDEQTPDGFSCSNCHMAEGQP